MSTFVLLQSRNDCVDGSNPQGLKVIVEWVVMFLETWKGLWDMHH